MDRSQLATAGRAFLGLLGAAIVLLTAAVVCLAAGSGAGLMLGALGVLAASGAWSAFGMVRDIRAGR